MPSQAEKHWPRGDGLAVLIIPGFGQSEKSTHGLRNILQQQGFQTLDWGMGRNMGLKPGMTTKLLNKLRKLHQNNGQAAAVVGWSLGGVIARELARKDPTLVSHVISLGSPIAGGHSTTLQPLLGLINGKAKGRKAGHDPQRYAPPPVPCTALYTRSDGIVNWQAALEPDTARTENIEVHGSHLGLGFNPAVWLAICHRLSPQTRNQRYTAVGCGEN
ncbi:MAG: esterase/lipase family protein [Oceanococcus sp.]